MNRLDNYAQRPTAHDHPHWHHETRPDGRRSVYRHSHPHSHPVGIALLTRAHALDGAQEYALHSRQPHDHPHDRAALDALTVGYVTRAA
jgi:hypothetical protein